MSVEVESDTKSADKRPSRGKKVNYSNLNKGIPQEEDKDEDSSSQLETAESGAGSSESDAPLVDPFYEQPGTRQQFTVLKRSHKCCCGGRKIFLKLPNPTRLFPFYFYLLFIYL